MFTKTRVHRLEVVMHEKDPGGSEEFHRLVKYELERRGHTISSWCRANGVSRISLTAACKGQRNGRKARELRRDLAALIGFGGAPHQGSEGPGGDTGGSVVDPRQLDLVAFIEARAEGAA